MSTVSSSTSYDGVTDFGRLYDAVPTYTARRDAAFYLEEAVASGGPVLEIGSGTGRVLLPIARAGVAITGVDGSQQMLVRCREKLDTESEATRQHVTLEEGDGRSFSLGRTFPLVIAPFRIVQQLAAIDDQLQFFTTAARHVAPGGRFIFDVFNPNFASLTSDRSAEIEDVPEQPFGDGRRLRRTFRIPRVRLVDQVNETELTYYLSAGAGQEALRYVQRFEMRWYLRAELIHLLARAGFRVTDIYGDFDRSPLTDASPEQVVCATLAH